MYVVAEQHMQRSMLGFVGLIGSRRACQNPTLGRIRTYHYNPLQKPAQIRLVRLQPNTDYDAGVVCTMDCVALDEGENSHLYEALSYVWGDPNPTNTISIIGSDPWNVDFQNSILPVGRNLYSSLRRLRLPDRERALWIDAICINQADVEERIQQIQIMREIYSHATEVVIWLGDDDEVPSETIGLAFGSLSKIHSAINEMHRKGEFEDMPIRRSTTTVANLSNALDPMSWDIWVAIAIVFQRPWFTRIWIIQEAAMAPRATFLWGQHSLDWEVLHSAAEAIKLASLEAMLPVDAASVGIDSMAVIGAMRRKVSEGGFQDEFDLMMVTRNHRATDPLDKMNAILGLMHPAKARIPFSYSKDVVECYKTLAVSWLYSSGGALAILSAATGGLEPSYPSLPSWVPEWTQTGIPQSLIASGHHFDACGGTRAHFSFSASNTVLHVTGIAVDRLFEVGDPYKIVDIHKIPSNGLELAYETRIATHRWVEQCCTIFNKHLSRTMTRKESIDLQWRVFICNRTIYSIVPRPDILEEFKDFIEFYNGENFMKDLLGDGAPRTMERQVNAGFYEATMKFWSAGRTFFATRNGNFGWAPQGSKAGDIACVLFGSSVILVLRPPIGNDGCHKLIGECYLHGFMNGEALQCDAYQVQEFKIA